jgi:hypothetical protein
MASDAAVDRDVSGLTAGESTLLRERLATSCCRRYARRCPGRRQQTVVDGRSRWWTVVHGNATTLQPWPPVKEAEVTPSGDGCHIG